MKRTRIIIGYIIRGLSMIVFLTGCAVVKTPYTRTDYYQKTVSRLDSLRSKINDENDLLYAGFARADITPDMTRPDMVRDEKRKSNIPMAGYGKRRGKSATGVHDSLFVKAIALKVGKKTAIIVSADLLIMPPNLIDSVTRLLSKEGLTRDQLFFSATHSHSSLGGWANNSLISKQFAGKENIYFQELIIKQIETAVLRSITDLQPARMGYDRFNASAYTRNRLTGEPDKKNDDFDFIVVEQTAGRKAIIGIFSAHATTLGSGNLEFSADYPGYWERKVEKTIADLALFCGGSMGSQSYISQGEGFESARYIGESLADSLSIRLDNVTMKERLSLSALSVEILLPEYHFRLTAKMNLSSGLSKMLLPVPENVYLQALRINNLIWVFTPGDFSGESALQIKNILKGKGYDAIVSGYNGSYVGYIIPGKYFYLDHYESRLMGWFGPTMGDYTMELIDRITSAIILR